MRATPLAGVLRLRQSLTRGRPRQSRSSLLLRWIRLARASRPTPWDVACLRTSLGAHATVGVLQALGPTSLSGLRSTNRSRWRCAASLLLEVASGYFLAGGPQEGGVDASRRSRCLGLGCQSMRTRHSEARWEGRQRQHLVNSGVPLGLPYPDRRGRRSCGSRRRDRPTTLRAHSRGT